MTNAQSSQDYWVLVGTYTRGDSKGIYVLRLDGESGKLSPAAEVEAVNPTFLAVHPSGRYVYAVGEFGKFEGRPTGAVTAYAFDRETGRLTRLNSVSSMGGSPCHVTVDSSGRFALVANYTGGNVAVLPINADGSLGEAVCVQEHSGSSAHPNRQTGPHPHSVFLDAKNEYAFVPDLGIDRVTVYAFDKATGALSPRRSSWAELRPGAGPRHMAFHPNQKNAYVINELDSTVTVFDYDGASGSLRPIQTLSTLPQGFDGNSTTAEVLVHPSGAFLYGSNRGHDSIASFGIASETGLLTPLGHASTQGRTPRNFAIDPTGRRLFAENQDSDSIVEFLIDTDGTLRPTGQVIRVPAPVCIKFVPC